MLSHQSRYKLHHIELCFMGGGLFCPFYPRGQGGGYVECPRLSTRGGEGVKIGSKLVHVVVECPLMSCSTANLSFFLQLSPLKFLIRVLRLLFFFLSTWPGLIRTYTYTLQALINPYTFINF